MKISYQNKVIRQYFVYQSKELKTGTGKRVDWGGCFLAIEDAIEDATVTLES